jgi:CheY-like chemotaxis protein
VTPSDTRKYRVLIVDDEEPIRQVFERILKQAGYDTMVAADGPNALGLLATAEPIDLLMTDLMMPAMNGDELARRVRVTEPLIKVLYVTGFADVLFTERRTLWEDEAFVEKPVSMLALREAVSLALFGHTRGPASPPP